MNSIRYMLLAASFGVGALNSAYAFEAPRPQTQTPLNWEAGICQNLLHGEVFFRTELFFGLSRPNITKEQFQQFLNKKVTPRFPDGLTLLSGKGQFKNASGVIVAEGSKLWQLSSWRTMIENDTDSRVAPEKSEAAGAPAEEIVITPEMIEAGVSIMEENYIVIHDRSEYQEIIRSVLERSLKLLQLPFRLSRSNHL